MRLKVLPPTLRKNNRYLTLDIKSVSRISKEDLVSIVWEGCVRFKGECGTSNFNLWVMRFYECGEGDGYFSYKAILRCQRDFVCEVRSALALISKFNGGCVSLTTVGLSGTVKGSHKFI
ncbi:MAG: ribonuclease P [Methanobrevibacter thaueri]|nr:ribonuclease P [Methanobrevibacter thaueri]